jgi:hypothetical protein
VHASANVFVGALASSDLFTHLLQGHGECLGSNSTRWPQKCGDVGLHQIQETMRDPESSDNNHIRQYGFFLQLIEMIVVQSHMSPELASSPYEEDGLLHSYGSPLRLLAMQGLDLHMDLL